jgi:hypothetical protein
LSCAAVVIGFLNTSYTVSESDGEAIIQIGVIRGSLERPVNVQFSINAISAASKQHDTSIIIMVISCVFFTYSAPPDYTSVSQALAFTNSLRVQTVRVPIVNDLTLELSEIFTVSLSLENSNHDHVKLVPNSVSVTISDDDGII